MATTESEIGAVFADVIKSWYSKYVKFDRDIGRELSEVGKTRLNRERLLGMLGQGGMLRESKHLFRCDDCDDFFKQFDPDVKGGRYGRKRKKKIGLTIDNDMNLVCREHANTIYLTKEEFEDIIFDEKEITATPITFQNVKTTRTGERIPRKCYGIHPHCSICGECHTNARTHDRGHPRR